MTISRPEGPGWKRNPGRQPDETRGKRIDVVLQNGKQVGTTPVTATAPPGWAADKARWEICDPPYAFDIIWYRVL